MSLEIIQLYYIILSAFLIPNVFKSKQVSNIIFVLFTQSKIHEFATNNNKLKMSDITQLLNVFVCIIIGHIYQIIVEIIKYVMSLFSQQIKLIHTASNPIELMIIIVSISKEIILCINISDSIHTLKLFQIVMSNQKESLLLIRKNSNVITREYALTFFDDSVETGLLELIEFRRNVTILKQYQIGFLFMIIVFVVGDVKASETKLILVIIDDGYNVRIDFCLLLAIKHIYYVYIFFLSQIEQIQIL